MNNYRSLLPSDLHSKMLAEGVRPSNTEFKVMMQHASDIDIAANELWKRIEDNTQIILNSKDEDSVNGALTENYYCFNYWTRLDQQRNDITSKIRNIINKDYKPKEHTSWCSILMSCIGFIGLCLIASCIQSAIH